MNRTEHYLTIAAEECAEIAQRCAKANRFGLEQVQQDADDKPEENPERLTNRERIREEFAHLVGVLDMLGIIDVSYIGHPDIRERAHQKQAKVERYLLRSQQCGTFDMPDPRPVLRDGKATVHD